MSNKLQKTREELAIGVLNLKTGKRTGGFVNMYRSMRQWQEWLTSGEKGEDDLIEAAFAKADQMIDKRAAGGNGDPGRLADDIADQEYRDAQEARYRQDYDWNTSNDEAELQRVLSLEVQFRATEREFAKANLNVKDRVALLGEIRNIAKDLASLQKSLGIDRPTRDSRKRSEDPMAALHAQIESGDAMLTAMMESFPAECATIKTLEELRAMIKMHWGVPRYDLIDPMLDAHRRILAAG